MTLYLFFTDARDTNGAPHRIGQQNASRGRGTPFMHVCLACVKLVHFIRL